MKKNIINLICLIAIGLGLALGPGAPERAAAAEIVPGVEKLSWIGGRFHGVAAAGSYAYALRSDQGLQIIDLSDPARPRERGSLAVGLQGPSELVVAGDKLLICDHSALWIVDVAQPDAPRELWHSNGACWDVVVVGQLAYVVAGLAGLSIFDISNPSSPQVVGTLHAINEKHMMHLAVAGPLVYIAGDYGYSITSGMLWVVDASNPSSPYLRNTLYKPTSGGYMDMQVRNGLLYSIGLDNLDTLDLADPINPMLINSRQLERASSLALSGRYAYVNRGNSAIDIYDIAEPNNVTLLQSIGDFSLSSPELAMSGNLLLVADYYGLQIVRLSPQRYPPPLERCFAATQQCISGRFRQYWEQNGGLPVFGYPITAVRDETNHDTGREHQTQWFERNRFELHPENLAPYDVLLGRLGAEWSGSFPPAEGPKAGCLWFAETQHNVCNQQGSLGFKRYWQSHGLEFDGKPGTSYAESLTLFGYPLGEPQVEQNRNGDTVLTQWFERARFEWHPGNADEYKVLLGLLGVESNPNFP